MQKPPEDAPGMHFRPLYFADGRLPYTEISQDCRPQHFGVSLSAPSLCKITWPAILLRYPWL
jgi:hypothetical protein